MEVKKVGKDLHFLGSRNDWIKYKKENGLFPAGLYEIDRKQIIWLILPQGKRPFCRR